MHKVYNIISNQISTVDRYWLTGGSEVTKFKMAIGRPFKNRFVYENGILYSLVGFAVFKRFLDCQVI